MISKTDIDALLAVFQKVFDEMCGYFGKQPHIAQFERHLDERGQFAAFKAAFLEVSGKAWETRGRQEALLEGRNAAHADGAAGSKEEPDSVAEPHPSHEATPAGALAEGHQVFAENRKGLSYDKLFGPYLDGATRVVVTDPYIRFFYQIRNMMEFVEMLIRRKSPEDQINVHLVTGPDDGNVARQRELLDSITAACTATGVDFSWAFDTSGTGHARDIVADTGWKIVLDRGLDIFQAPVKSDGFNLSDRLQEHRAIKGFYVTYVRQQA